MRRTRPNATGRTPRLWFVLLALTALAFVPACESKSDDSGEKEQAAGEGAGEEGAEEGEAENEGQADEGEADEAGAAPPADEPAADVNLLEDVDIETFQKRLQSSEAKVILVNAWATWCGPCVEEFPYLVKLSETYADQGLEVIFLSGDMEKERDKAIEFLKEQGVDYTTYRQSGDETAFINGMTDEWEGSLPATFIYDAERELVKFHPTSATYEEFEAMVKPLLEG